MALTIVVVAEAEMWGRDSLMEPKDRDMSEQLVVSGFRYLILESPFCATQVSIPKPFAVLVPAFDESERRQIEEIAMNLVNIGCEDFCCVGPESELLHDALDWLFVDNENETIDVVTSAFEDESDACEYFLFAAGAQMFHLLALVSLHPELTSLLKQIGGMSHH